MRSLITIVFATLLSVAAFGQDVPSGKPTAQIDLTKDDGVKLFQGQWRYSDTRIVETEFLSAGSDGQPSGPSVKTYDYEPHAGGVDFDDSKWEKVPPSELSKRRGNGKLSFNWYRTTLTVPESVNGISTAGSTIVLQIAIDDYAEVWVDGELTRFLG